MTDTERRTLALRLFGSGKPGEPGPLDPGWVVEQLAGSRQTLSRWRKVGIPPDRIEEVLEAVRAALELPGTTKEAAPSMTRRLLTGIIALERRANISPNELASAQESAAAIEAALEVDARLAAELTTSRRTSGGRAAGQGGGRAAGSLGNTPRKP